jgi:hypothetical protein
MVLSRSNKLNKKGTSNRPGSKMRRKIYFSLFLLLSSYTCLNIGWQISLWVQEGLLSAVHIFDSVSLLTVGIVLFYYYVYLIIKWTREH